MKIQSIKIISNNISFGPMPKSDEVVEQRLTVSRNGRVWFSSYMYGEGFDKHVLKETKHATIGRIKADEMFELLEEMNESYLPILCTDIGSWELIIKDCEKKTVALGGSLIGEVLAGDLDLTSYIRNVIPIDGLWIFDSIRMD